jgi:hypothetical protein
VLGRLLPVVHHPCGSPPSVGQATPNTLRLTTPHSATIAHVFEDWDDDPEYPTLYRVDREVIVDVSRAFPGITRRRQDELALCITA